MKRSSRRPAALATTAAALTLLGGALQLQSASAAPAPANIAAVAATGGPGAPSYFDLARKDCLGTAANTTSKVWYTVADGVLSDVYEPTIDNTNVETLQYIVTDGSTFTDLQTRDMTYTVQADPTGMECTITSTDAKHGFALVTTYITDPQRDTVLMNTRIEPTKGSGTNVGALRIYARLDAHVNGDGGGGAENAGGNTGVVDARTGIPVVYSTNTTTEAANRTYAVPTYMAMTATSAGEASVGYEGTASDGLTQLDAAHALTPTTSAADGHIVATEDVTPQRGSGGGFTLALGFGRSQQQAVNTAAASLRTPFPFTALAYASTWNAYDRTLNRPPRSVPGQSEQTIRITYYLDANVLKASEDKTFPGAVVASLASPWGQAINAGDDVNGQPVLDSTISVKTPSGTGYYRYGTNAADGSADGYGDCYQPSQTSCTTVGEPWPTTDVGTGHLWPVLSGERGESAIAEGDASEASAMLSFMINSASGEGLVPEQVWEDPDVAASPYGSDPTTASIGFTDGQAAGSASPLTWAQAQELRLIVDLGTGRDTDTPAITTARYVTHGAPAATTVTITSPASGATIEGGSATVTGTTAAGATVDILTQDTDTGAAATTVTATADASGAYSAPVAIGFGTNVITAVATTASGATGYAQTSVIGDVSGGTTVLSVTDPTGDDNGPGTYQYPTSSSYSAGSWDLTGFQVITAGSEVYLRTSLANLVPTFGSVDGAQLLDIYVHSPAATATSTAAAFPTRNYTIASADAWSERLEIQGFASPVWVDPSGGQVGTPTAVVASTVANTITIALPEAEFGTPTSGWTFTVAVTGQDGFNADQAISFTMNPGAFTLGICPVGGTEPICSLSPSAVPEVMDTITPPGVLQDTELNPVPGPVVLQGVTVP